MRKRQFGSDKKIYASEFNTAENYAELNIKEVAADASLEGIVSGGESTPHIVSQYTVVLEPTIMRTSTGERITISANENIFIKPSASPGSGNEVYITAYAEYAYLQGEADIDGDSHAYYKDYQNSYAVSTIQGSIATIGNAIPPTIPGNSVLICDILYNVALYASGNIQQSDIDTSRQQRTAVGVAASIFNTTTKATPVDADVVGYLNSADSFALVKATWANIKAFLKTYFDTLYNYYIHPSIEDFIHLPAGGSLNQLIKNSGTAGTGAWGTVTEDTGALANITNINLTEGVVDESNNVIRLLFPGGAIFTSTGNPTTGTIKIRLPKRRSNTMMNMHIKIYEHSSSGTDGNSIELTVGGKNSSTLGNWENYFAIQTTMGGDNINVRFGEDASGSCIWIGELTSEWNFLKVYVTDFQAGGDAATAANWSNGWVITTETFYDTGGVKHTVEAARLWHQNNDGTGSGLDADVLDGTHAIAFALLAGRSGSQRLFGGTSTGEALILTNNTVDNYNLTIENDGTISTNVTNYETLVLNDNDIPNKKFVDDEITTHAYTHPNHTGEVTSLGDGATVIENGVVSNYKLSIVSQNTIKGRITTSTGYPEDLTDSQVRTIINVEDGANNYSLPTATSTGLGGIIVGTNLTITPWGVLSATGSTGGNPITVGNYDTSTGLLSSQTLRICTNSGAIGEVTLTLPTAEAALKFTFVVREAQYLRIQANTGDTIRSADVVSESAGYFRNNVIGSVLTIMAVDATEWVTEVIIGTWLVDS